MSIKIGTMMRLAEEKSTKFSLFNFKSISTPAFWITSIFFFLCFFAWFCSMPLFNKKAIGSVSVIVGVVGNVGAF